MTEIVQFVRDIIGILAILGIVIEVTPIKINPFSWIGQRLNIADIYYSSSPKISHTPLSSRISLTWDFSPLGTCAYVFFSFMILCAHNIAIISSPPLPNSTINNSLRINNFTQFKDHILKCSIACDKLINVLILIVLDLLVNLISDELILLTNILADGMLSFDNIYMIIITMYKS